jgi:hypothetical protein
LRRLRRPTCEAAVGPLGELMRADSIMNNPTITVAARAALRGVSFAAGMASAMQVSAAAAPRYYGYSYGPEVSYNYIAFGSEPFCMSRPILSLDGYWRDRTKRRAIVIIKGGHILIR